VDEINQTKKVSNTWARSKAKSNPNETRSKKEDVENPRVVVVVNLERKF
jgi:hypothetical protein